MPLLLCNPPHPSTCESATRPLSGKGLWRERERAIRGWERLPTFLFLFPDNDMPSDIPRLFDIASPALLPPVLPFCPEFPPPTDDRRSLGFARFRSLSPLSVSPTPCTPDPISGTRIAGE
ncbi:hypothetical protein TNCT_468651 [Trichonephila clavata]|uniref:Uncharacterized protein n=1 Tax=Trichonephila clavata TaxID=2740835 RepID=A0A8X6LFF1_TRICU|nr:hypothetical protein TNCT_468651 [Trichonephila clavata]